MIPLPVKIAALAIVIMNEALFICFTVVGVWL